MAKKTRNTESQRPLVLSVGYRGRVTNEVYYPPGVYEADSPLYANADYLVSTGRAHWSGEAPSNIAPVDRDLSGKPISLPLPQAESVVDPVKPIYEQDAIRTPHNEMIYPWHEQALALLVAAPSDKDLDNLAALIQRARSQAAVMGVPSAPLPDDPAVVEAANALEVYEPLPPDEDDLDSEGDEGDEGDEDETDSLEESYSQAELFKMAQSMGITDAKANWSKTKLAEAIEAKRGGE